MIGGAPLSNPIQKPALCAAEGWFFCGAVPQYIPGRIG